MADKSDDRTKVYERHIFDMFGFEARQITNGGLVILITSSGTNVRYDIPFNKEGREMLLEACLPTDATERKQLAQRLLGNRLVLPHELNNQQEK